MVLNRFRSLDLASHEMGIVRSNDRKQFGTVRYPVPHEVFFVGPKQISSCIYSTVYCKGTSVDMMDYFFVNA